MQFTNNSFIVTLAVQQRIIRLPTLVAYGEACNVSIFVIMFAFTLCSNVVGHGYNYRNSSVRQLSVLQILIRNCFKYVFFALL